MLSQLSVIPLTDAATHIFVIHHLGKLWIRTTLECYDSFRNLYSICQMEQRVMSQFSVPKHKRIIAGAKYNIITSCRLPCKINTTNHFSIYLSLNKWYMIKEYRPRKRGLPLGYLLAREESHLQRTALVLVDLAQQCIKWLAIHL